MTGIILLSIVSINKRGIKVKLKILWIVVTILGCLCLGCTSDNEKIVLDVQVNYTSTESVYPVYEKVVEAFEATHPNIDVNLSPSPADYESVMKSKMAVNDLPDLFTTHGWSVARYSEFLLPLTDQSWIKDLNPAIAPVITNSSGDVFVLPLDVDVAGIAYNKDVLHNAGVSVDDLTTWQALLDSMETIKNEGITPVYMSGKNLGDIAQFFDWLPPAIYVTDPANDLSDDLLSGHFDVETWTLATRLLKEIQDKGYLNVDALTADRLSAARALATGETAYEFFGNYIITDALEFNPEANLGFFPVPAYYDSGEPFLISGERNAMGIWKDSEHIEEAKMFLNYLATPEVMSQLASAHKIPAGLVTASSDTGMLKSDFDKYADVVGSPYFDRVYLPSGMWDTLGATGAGVLSGSMTPEEAAQIVKEDFDKLFNKN